MISQKICQKCETFHPLSTMFCPACGSLTVSPEPPAKPSPVNTTAKRRPGRVTTTMVVPANFIPPKVKAEHSRADFDSALASNDVPQEDVDVITRLMEWSAGVSDTSTFGDTMAEGGRIGYRPKLRLPDREVSLFWVSADGRVEVDFSDWIHTQPFDSREKRIEMLRKLNGIKGVRISEDKVAGRPPIPVRALRDPGEYAKFIETYRWFIGLVRGA